MNKRTKIGVALSAIIILFLIGVFLFIDKDKKNDIPSANTELNSEVDNNENKDSSKDSDMDAKENNDENVEATKKEENGLGKDVEEGNANVWIESIPEASGDSEKNSDVEKEEGTEKEPEVEPETPSEEEKETDWIKGNY